MNTTTVSIRIDSDLKKQMEKICKELGMSMATAYTIFTKKCVEERGIPFPVKLAEPNDITYQAMEAAEKGAVYGPFNSVKELMDDLNADD